MANFMCAEGGSCVELGERGSGVVGRIQGIRGVLLIHIGMYLPARLGTWQGTGVDPSGAGTVGSG